MATEIERKFLVDPEKVGPLPTGTTIKQGYIPAENGTTIRVRTRDNTAYLTLKGKTQGLSRAEFEYTIPLTDAEYLLQNFCLNEKIEKTRYEIPYAGHVWELDIFDGLNKGLLLAEVELNDESQHVDLPDWVTEDVSHDSRYYNSNLLKAPFSRW